CEDEGHRSLTELLRRNLVMYDGQEKRYRLHDLARVFASSRLLEDGAALQLEGEGAGWRHSEYFQEQLSRADELYEKGGEKIVEGLALFDRERANIEAGQAWAAMRMKENRKAARLVAEYPIMGAYVLNLRLHSGDQIEWLLASVEAAREIGDRRGEGNALG